MVHSNRERGFTITEIMIIVIVLGILGGIGYVGWSMAITNSKTNAAKTNATAVKNAADQFNSRYGAYPTNAQIQGVGDTIKLPDGVSLQNSPILTKNDPQTKIFFRATPSSGPPYRGNCIGYYDYAAGTMKVIYTGTATNLDTASLACS